MASPDLEGLLDEMTAVLPTPSRRLGPDDDFFAAGGDSLSASELFARLEERWSEPWPPSLLVPAPTARELLPRLVPGGGEAVTEIQSGGSKTALLVVCGASGAVFGARRLSDMLGAEQPVVALAPAIRSRVRPEVLAVPEVMADYLEAGTARRAWRVLGAGGGSYPAALLVGELLARGHHVRDLTVAHGRPWPLTAAPGPVPVPLLVLEHERAPAVDAWAPLSAHEVRVRKLPGAPGRAFHSPALEHLAREWTIAGML